MSKELTQTFRLLKQFNYRGYERKRIKRWCHRHYGHHKKRISYKFVIVG